jgi:O-glycosyl hydrolase
MSLNRRKALTVFGATGASAILGVSAVSRVNAAETTTAASAYKIQNHAGGVRQTILGLGFEIQSDHIGALDNEMDPDDPVLSGAPHDLIASERTRFYNSILKAGRSDRGFRYCRMAQGLWLRGVSADRKQITGRWSTQMSVLREMHEQAALDGLAAQYWCPAPYWKSTQSLLNGTLACFASSFTTTHPEYNGDKARFLSDFGDAVVRDLRYLEANGLPVRMWGLQNEPGNWDRKYASCGYTADSYLQTFKAVAPKVRAAFPNVLIHVDSRDGQSGAFGTKVRSDTATLSYVDAWTHHYTSTSPDKLSSAPSYYIDNTVGREVFNDEFEWEYNPAGNYETTVNTAQSIMNWMTFANSRTWFWLHALKPTYTNTAGGYGLGIWRPFDDADYSKYPNIQQRHWDYNAPVWNAVSGFAQYLPWNSVRYHVDEPLNPATGKPNVDKRIMAWKTPAGKLVFALTHRVPNSSTATAAPHTFTVDTGSTRTFTGHRYRWSPHTAPLAENNVNRGTVTGPALSITLAPNTIEFWIENI